MAQFEVGAEYRLTVYAEGFDPVTIDPLVMPPMSSGSDRTEFRLKFHYRVQQVGNNRLPPNVEQRLGQRICMIIRSIYLMSVCFL